MSPRHEAARQMPAATAILPVLPSPTVVVSEVPAEATPPAAVVVAPTPEVEMPSAYTVQAGDTLLGIAMAFDVPMAAVQLANDLGSTTLIHLGQVLEIPAAQAWAGSSPFWVVHEVQVGETLGEIAALNSIGLAELIAANSDLDADRITVGQAVILPLHGPQEMLAKATVPESQPVAPVTTPAPEVAAQSEPVIAPTEVALPVAPPADVAALPAEIFRLVNAERAAFGLPPLAWNDTLARAAQRHADDCYARGWCSHIGSDGSTYSERIIREGYDPVRWSECWAWYGSAERAVAMWMDEVAPNDPHRRTILNDALTEVGVGVVPGNGFGYYFIADFGTPR